jgi:hypothetical protein
MDANTNVSRQILLNASRSMKHEMIAFRHLSDLGFSQREIKLCLRRVGVFTKIRKGGK